MKTKKSLAGALVIVLAVSLASLSHAQSRNPRVPRSVLRGIEYAKVGQKALKVGLPVTFHTVQDADHGWRRTKELDDMVLKFFNERLKRLATNYGTRESPVSIIFDTDTGTNVDDAGALALLHRLARMGVSLYWW